MKYAHLIMDHDSLEQFRILLDMLDDKQMRYTY